MPDSPGAGASIILEIGAEGGSITLRGRMHDDMWQYQVTTNEAALYDEDEAIAVSGEPSVRVERPWLDSWEGALRQLGRYPWPKLTPIRAHTDFATRILDAVRSHRVTGEREVHRWTRWLRSWAGLALPGTTGAPRRRPFRVSPPPDWYPFVGEDSATSDVGSSEGRVTVVGPRGHRIHNLDDWKDLAPPAMGAAHWKDGRSAKELARAWCTQGEPRVPSELARLLSTCDATRGLRIATAFPEHETTLDELGKGRQHDLVLCGTIGQARLVVAVEAKADDPLARGSTRRSTPPSMTTSAARARAGGPTGGVNGSMPCASSCSGGFQTRRFGACDTNCSTGWLARCSTLVRAPPRLPCSSCTSSCRRTQTRRSPGETTGTSRPSCA